MSWKRYIDRCERAFEMAVLAELLNMNPKRGFGFASGMMAYAICEGVDWAHLSVDELIGDAKGMAGAISSMASTYINWQSGECEKPEWVGRLR